MRGSSSVVASICALFLGACQTELEVPGGKAGAAGSQPSAAGAGGSISLVPANGELCDGLDNDGNGAIDDADVEGDGVCDCLKIASIGHGGEASSGKLAFQDWPNAHAQNHVVALGESELTDELLAPYKVIILLNVATTPTNSGDRPRAAFTDAEVESFGRWVHAGGGVITTAGYNPDQAAEVVNVNRLLGPFGLGYSTSKISLNGMVKSWVPHPVTEGVTQVFTEVGTEPDGLQALTLAKDTQEHVALQVSQDDDAHILVWGDEWITYASQWQANRDRQVERFWLNAITWLSGSQTCQQPQMQSQGATSE